MAEKSSNVLFVLFDGIHKKRSNPSEHLVLESKGAVILKNTLPDAFILTPFMEVHGVWTKGAFLSSLNNPVWKRFWKSNDFLHRVLS